MQSNKIASDSKCSQKESIIIKKKKKLTRDTVTKQFYRNPGLSLMSMMKMPEATMARKSLRDNTRMKA